MPNHKKYKKPPLTAKQRKNISKAMRGNKNAVGADSGRPVVYTPAVGKKVRDMLLAMFPITKIAEIIGVHRDTLYAWRKEYTEFSDMWEFGENGIDTKVVRSLSKRAAGFRVKVEKPFKIKDEKTGADKIINHKYLEYHPPDTRAAEIWLRNRGNVKKNWSSIPAEDAPPPPIPTNVMNQIDWSKVDDATIRKLIEAIKPEDPKG